MSECAPRPLRRPVPPRPPASLPGWAAPPARGPVIAGRGAGRAGVKSEVLPVSRPSAQARVVHPDAARGAVHVLHQIVLALTHRVGQAGQAARVTQDKGAARVLRGEGVAGVDTQHAACTALLLLLLQTGLIQVLQQHQITSPGPTRPHHSLVHGDALAPAAKLPVALPLVTAPRHAAAATLWGRHPQVQRRVRAAGGQVVPPGAFLLVAAVAAALVHANV
ncbi:hypothetical protein E2C01_062767 [Portunus trituberculatus]|uniref:Uncharacterized protein n=1 Tax=Portunus trituberculatus TaxID=210409 RepID=A0A5B7HG62_PORTR|nr:hypothetical protein [Portunus trituberculatus]